MPIPHRRRTELMTPIFLFDEAVVVVDDVVVAVVVAVVDAVVDDVVDAVVVASAA